VDVHYVGARQLLCERGEAALASPLDVQAQQALASPRDDAQALLQDPYEVAGDVPHVFLDHQAE
tara:strand:- start:305 stop:496 length:192 start_codon:yes stop_codon:yes gene_type:complete